jgi:hypothetical protein
MKINERGAAIMSLLFLQENYFNQSSVVKSCSDNFEAFGGLSGKITGTG